MRDQARVIARIPTSGPAEEHRHYLYLLPLHRRGATSFEDLKRLALPTATWPEAALANGIIVADDEYDGTLAHAAELKLQNRSASSSPIVD